MCVCVVRGKKKKWTKRRKNMAEQIKTTLRKWIQNRKQENKAEQRRNNNAENKTDGTAKGEIKKKTKQINANTQRNTDRPIQEWETASSKAAGSTRKNIIEQFCIRFSSVFFLLFLLN